MAGERDRDLVLALRSAPQALDCVGRDGEEVHALRSPEDLAVARALRLVETGEREDVAHEHGQAMGVLVDPPGEPLDVLGPGDAVANELGRALDGGDGRLELVRHVGGEVAPHVGGVLDGVHALHELLVLLVEAAHERVELLVGRNAVAGRRVDLKDRPHEAPGEPAGDHPARPHEQDGQAAEHRQVLEEEGDDPRAVDGQADHLARL